MPRLPLLIGSLLGVLAAIGVLAVEDAARRKPPELATVQSDGEGPISELVIQYLPEADEIVLRVYRQFLREPAIADSRLKWRIVVVTHTVHNSRSLDGRLTWCRYGCPIDTASAGSVV